MKVILQEWLPRIQSLKLLLLAVLLFASNVEAQTQRPLSGVVTDNQGAPLPGASVKVKDSPEQTSTGSDGGFKIVVPANRHILIFSYIGMQTREVEVSANQKNLHVTLLPSAKDLNEVVVVGYGTMKKSDLTGAVSTLKGGELNKTPASSVDQLLQGKIPGVQVTTSGGQPGSGATIRIRGASSLYGSKDPLVVVDGYPWGDAGNLKQINPEDIESIEVLKDASSAAIYGSRGANGVIMVTTKKGRAGKPRITLSTLNTISTMAVKPDVWRDPVEEATFANEAAITGGAIATDIPYIGISRPFGTGNTMIYYPSIAELRGLDPNKPKWPTNTNWVDLVYRNPFSQSYTLSADGGSDKTTYAISGNYYKEEGLAIKNDYDKYTGRLNLDQKLTNAINVGTNVVLAYTTNKGFGLGAGRSTIFPAYDENGNYFRTSNTDYGNPLALANELLNTTHTVDFLGGFYANFKIAKWLQFRTTLNSKFGNSVQDQYDPIGSTQRAMDNKGSYGSINNGNYRDLLNENYFTIDKSFGTDHEINFVGGFSIEKTLNRFSTLTGQNFVNDALTNQNLSTAGTMLINNDLQRYDLQSWYGRANYTFKDRYLFTVTARADGSTKFGANNKWGYFPSGAFAWKANEEPFIKSLNVFSELKFRVSYGLTGNQAISPYASLDRFGSYKYYTGTGFETGFGPGLAGANDEQGNTIVGGLGNKSLKWETTKTLDLGFDLGVMNQRITLTADYYEKTTNDLLRLKTIAPSAGYDQQWVNDGKVSNKGVEVGLNADLLRHPDFTWNVGANFTLNRNKVLAMGENNQIFVGTLYESVRSKISTYTVGQPLFAFYGFKTDGIIQTSDIANGLPSGLSADEAQAGEIKYLDISGPDGTPDGVVDDYDKTIIGNPNPDYIYSFNTSLKYKNFDFSAQLYGVQGNDVWDFQKLTPSRELQRWTLDNPSNEYPRARSNPGYRASDFYITDGSFLRIQNVTLGYTLKPHLIKAISNLRVYLSANNLYTFTKFNVGYDPELGENGINGGAYPRPRAFSLGLNVGF